MRQMLGTYYISPLLNAATKSKKKSGVFWQYTVMSVSIFNSQ